MTSLCLGALEQAKHPACLPCLSSNNGLLSVPTPRSTNWTHSVPGPARVVTLATTSTRTTSTSRSGQTRCELVSEAVPRARGGGGCCNVAGLASVQRMIKRRPCCFEFHPSFGRGSGVVGSLSPHGTPLPINPGGTLPHCIVRAFSRALEARVPSANEVSNTAARSLVRCRSAI